MLIGVASLLMLLFNGKILGISGIIGGILRPRGGDKTWRFAFLMGLVTGGAILLIVRPEAFTIAVTRSPLALVMAGLLVGYGTQLGKGCTSGHGICGVSRLSPRSIVATLTFMLSGILTVFVMNHWFGGQI